MKLNTLLKYIKLKYMTRNYTSWQVIYHATYHKYRHKYLKKILHKRQQ